MNRNTNRSVRVKPCYIAAIVFVLLSCSVGPDYEPPKSETPATWLGASKEEAAKATGAKSVAFSGQQLVVEWWSLFNDPQLSSLVERGLQSNLDLKLAEARIREARAARGIERADYFPVLSSPGIFRRSDTGPIPAKDIASSKENRNIHNLFDKGFDASWEIDIFGGTRRSVEAADSKIDSSIEDLRDVQLSVMAEVARNYIELRGLQKQIEVAGQNLQAQERSAVLSQQKFETGFVSALDLRNAEAQVLTTKAQIPSLESAARRAIYNISILLGSEPGKLLAELSEAKAVPMIPPEVSVGLPSELLQRRPDIRRAEADLHAATAEIGVATAELYPSFSLSGAYGIQSPTLQSFTNWSNRYWNFGSFLGVPIFEGWLIRSKIEMRTAIQEQALIAYQKTILAALQEVENALVSYSEEQKRLESLRLAVEANRQAVDLASKLYVGGESDFLNVLVAQRQLFASEEALVQTEKNVATTLVALFKALGGGWEKADIHSKSS